MSTYVKKGYNPKSRGNLKPGCKVKDKATLQAMTKRMNAARKDAMRVRCELKAMQLSPLQAFRWGYRLGQNQAYMRWRDYATKRIQEAYRRLA